MGKHLKKRFTLALLKEECSNRVDNIRKINEDLYRLINGARQYVTNLSTSRADLSEIANHYKLVRDGAQSMWDTLKQHIEVPHGCACDHHVSLCLDMRGPFTPRRDGSRHNHGTGIKQKLAPTFRFLFCLAGGNPEDVASIQPMAPVTWKELEMELIFGSDDESDGEQQHTESHSESHHSDEKIPLVAHVRELDQVPLNRSRISIGNAGQSHPSISGKSHHVHNLASTTTLHANVSPVSQSNNNRECGTGDRISNARPQINNICMTIKGSIQTTERQSLGFLTSDCEKVKFQLWLLPFRGYFGLAVDGQYSEWRSEPVSLLALLQNGPSMVLKDRLYLGIKLANPVIQLRQTSWLKESWGKQDIVFFTEPHTRRLLIENPMVLHNLSAPQPVLTQQPPGIVREDKLLFSLGVVLWELWYFRRLEDDPDLNACLDNNQLSNTMLNAKVGRAVAELGMEAGRKYYDAVQRCIYGIMPTGAEEYSTIVWQKVVCPLEENYSSFCGV